MKNIFIPMLLLFAIVLVAGCTETRYQPLVDVKASKQPANVQEDQMFCEWLANHAEATWFGPDDKELTRRCLKGRGVSVLR